MATPAGGEPTKGLVRPHVSRSGHQALTDKPLPQAWLKGSPSNPCLVEGHWAHWGYWRWVVSEVLPKVKEFKCLKVVFMSEKEEGLEMDVTLAVLHLLCRSVVVKTELSSCCLLVGLQSSPHIWSKTQVFTFLPALFLSVLSELKLYFLNVEFICNISQIKLHCMYIEKNWKII